MKGSGPAPRPKRIGIRDLQKDAYCCQRSTGIRPSHTGHSECTRSTSMELARYIVRAALVIGRLWRSTGVRGLRAAWLPRGDDRGRLQHAQHHGRGRSDHSRCVEGKGCRGRSNSTIRVGNSPRLIITLRRFEPAEGLLHQRRERDRGLVAALRGDRLIAGRQA